MISRSLESISIRTPRIIRTINRTGRIWGATVVLAAAMTLTGLPRAHPRATQHLAADPQVQRLREQSLRYIQSNSWQQLAEVCERGAEAANAANDQVFAVKFLNNVGGAELKMFNYQAAIDAFLKAKAIAEKQRDGQAIAASDLNLVSVYLQQNNLVAANPVAAQGLKVAGTSDPWGFRSPILLATAVLRWEEKQKSEALTYFREAIEAARAKGNQNQVADAWDSLGNTRLDSGEFAAAEGPLAEGFRLRLLFQDPSLNSSYFSLSRLRLALGDPDSAAHLLDRAISQGIAAATVPVWSIHWVRGKILEAQHRPDEALVQFEMAADAWQGSGDKLTPADAHRTSLASYRKIDALFTSLIQTSIAKKPVPHVEAFLAAERYRAIAMQQSRTQSPTWRKRLDPQYWVVLSELRKAQVKNLIQPGPDLRMTQLQQTLTEYEVRAGLPPSRTIRNKSNENTNPTETLRDIEGSLGPEEALLSFYLGDPDSAVWAVTDRAVEYHRLPSRELLSRAAGRFRQAVEYEHPDRDATGEVLHNWLFQDVSPAVQHKPIWLIAAADELFDIPMAALVAARREGKPVYLVQQHATERIPSALMLRKQSVFPSDGSFLGVADGIYNVADPRWKAASSAFNRFGMLLARRQAGPTLQMPRLAGSSQEIQACARIWQGSRPAVLLTGARASREALQVALRNRPAVLHLAAHVLSPKNSPQDAVISFGLSPQGEPELLTNDDIGNLQVQGTTVVVNGCASGDVISRAEFGAGAMGLTRAWLLAGAQNVVGSRWPIPDDSGDLFQSFYSRLSKSRGGALPERVVAQALQQAQLEALHGNTWRSNPKYWGAFYVFGKD